jgi:hypothetical protein
MTSRDFLILGLVLTALVVVLAFANFYYIQPSLTPELPKPEKLPPAETYKAPIDRNIVATTLEKIRTMFPKKEFQKGFEPRRVERNPFFWPEEILGKRYAKVSAEEREDGGRGLPRLNMILIGENKKIALINDKILFEGSSINGDNVHRIKEKEVVLRGDTGETRLSLSEYSFAPAVEEELALPETSPKTPAQEETIESLFEKLKPLLQSGQ